MKISWPLVDGWWWCGVRQKYKKESMLAAAAAIGQGGFHYYKNTKNCCWWIESFFLWWQEIDTDKCCPSKANQRTLISCFLCTFFHSTSLLLAKQSDIRAAFMSMQILKACFLKMKYFDKRPLLTIAIIRLTCSVLMILWLNVVSPRNY